MSERIRKVYKANPTLKSGAIAAILDIDAAYVYNVLWHYRKKQGSRPEASKPIETPARSLVLGDLLRERLNSGIVEEMASWDDNDDEVAASTAPAAPEPVSANNVQVGGTHYKSKSIQPWDYVAANGLGYFEGNVIKYVTRYKDKGGVADLEKAKHYLEKLIEVERG